MLKIALIIISFNFLTINILQGQCPDEGSARSLKLQNLNRLKNRSVIGPDSINDTSIEDILQDGMDTARWTNDYYWGLSGYLYKWKYGGPETCNCKSTDKLMWDIHLVIAASPDETDESNMMIWEITRKSYEAYPQLNDPVYLNSLRGQKVYGEGYAFGDIEHWNNATNSGHASQIWRKTIWEIHPVLVLQPADIIANNIQSLL